MTYCINRLRSVVAAIVVATVAGCAATQPAPVVERDSPVGRVPPKVATSPQSVPAPAPAPKPDAGVVVTPLGSSDASLYTVKQGDTLFSIAKANGVSVRDVVAWNSIEDPSSIKVGQQLRLSPPGGVIATPTPPGSPAVRPADAPPPADANTRTTPLAQRVPYSDEAYTRMSKSPAAAAIATAPETKPDAKPEAKPEVKPEAPRGDGEVDWSWPTEGKVIANYNGGSNKGIVIAGKRGQAVNATAGGRVILSGAGIRGLGNMIVIRHNANYLSVYAHNDKLLVKEGQTVRKGQRIADMGSSDSDQVKLHFEIRRQGKPVDPAALLPGT